MNFINFFLFFKVIFALLDPEPDSDSDLDPGTPLNPDPDTDPSTQHCPEVLSQLLLVVRLHPQGWVAVSRNTSSDEASEWCCVHDIHSVETRYAI
jgi:hypothetical protein